MIDYRIATKDDHEAIYDFALHATSDAKIPEFAEDVGEALQDRLAKGETTIIIALSGEQVVAYAEIDLTRQHLGGVFIQGVYVDRGFRRQGIGGKILDMVKAKFCTKGEKVLTRAYTSAGKNFWESWGYKPWYTIMKLEEKQKS
ncbi:MAG: GNAT family N-acetyltransferase [Candidatus Heimdallarchaeota archaeon]|nr:GNAT family N-acetyltransferase [Candidatus Heimdallarchaeota archaeon]